MSITAWTGLTLLILGVVVWFFGNRLWLMGAGAGALLGVVLLTWFPFLAGGFVGFLIVAGLAVALGVLAFIGKAFTKIIAMVVGFIAGGAIVIAILELFNANASLLVWLIAVIGGVIGAVLFLRYFDWALIILASLLGSVLVVRGALDAALPVLQGAMGGLLILVLTAVGIWYHYRRLMPKTAKTSPKAT
ncbi:MAG: hypothetical protein U0X20_10970 [Caldilineaceae bacterium]